MGSTAPKAGIDSHTSLQFIFSQVTDLSLLVRGVVCMREGNVGNLDGV